MLEEDNEYIYRQYCRDCPIYESNALLLADYIDTEYKGIPSWLYELLGDEDFFGSSSDVDYYKGFLDAELLNSITYYLEDYQSELCAGIFEISRDNCIEDKEIFYFKEEITATFQPHAFGVVFIKDNKEHLIGIEMFLLRQQPFLNNKGFVFAPYKFTNVYGEDWDSKIPYGRVCKGTMNIPALDESEVDILDFYLSFIDSYFNMDVSDDLTFNEIKETIENTPDYFKPYKELVFSEDCVDYGTENVFLLGNNHMKLLSGEIEI
jgi:hypothetical protein